jgi:hypothetical protein
MRSTVENTATLTPDPEREGEDGRDREPARAQQRSQGVANV